MFDVAVALIARQGYEETTLRQVAERARVSPALLYRYFPNKRALVLALYDDLSADYVRRAMGMPRGTWRARFVWALEVSLDVLRPQRTALKALIPVMVAAGGEGLFAESTAFSRQRVQAVFDEAVAAATDAPGARVTRSLGRLLYLLHLAVLLWWLLDKSAGQRATAGLVDVLRRVLPSAAMMLRLPPIRSFVLSLDDLIGDALMAESGR